MTYDSREISAFGGQPIEYFEFIRTSLDVYRYTTADADQTLDGFVYTALPIQRGKITQSQNILKSDLKIDITRVAPFALTYIEAPPATRRFARSAGETFSAN